MSLNHANISIFVTHIGCPHLCSFCNQVHITGNAVLPDEETVDNAVSVAKNSRNFSPENTEIAFFGGSFTAIDRKYMISLLESAYKYVKNGTVKGIRISTRPDYIDKEVLTILKNYGVTSIELGAQSMYDEVLEANERGHTAGDVVSASRLIKDYGFSLGLQMMTGLYKSDFDKDIGTAEKIIGLKPDTVRIYPTVILKNTALAKKYESGEYKPYSFDETAELCAKLLLRFEEENIAVIRLGLHSVEEGQYLAGTFHPAFREICQSRIFFNKILELLDEKGDYILLTAPSEISKVIGQKKENLLKLENLGYHCTVHASSELGKYDIIARKTGENLGFNLNSNSGI